MAFSTLNERKENTSGKLLSRMEGELLGQRESAMTVAELQGSITRQEARLAASATELAASRAEVARLEQVIATAEARIRVLQDESAHKDSDVNRLKRELERAMYVDMCLRCFAY